jgi:DUF3048 family protein
VQRVALAVCTIAVIVGLAGLVVIAVSTRQPVPVALPRPLQAASEPATQARSAAPASALREPAALPTAPLTGLPVDDAAVVARPVVAVGIDNAAQARPQSGLDQADIVFEEPIEGSLTRFVALFHSADPGTVGPIRRGTSVDADLLPAFSAVLGVSKATAGAGARLRATGLRILSEEQAPARTFFRALDRPAPHNLFARPLELWRAGAGLPPAASAWPFSSRPPLGGQPAPNTWIVFSPSADVEWTWHAKRHAWLRRQDGRVHRVSSGAQVAAENIVVVMTPGGIDAGSESSINALEVIGEGTAVVLRDGLAYNIRWRKASPFSQFEWVTRGGSPLPLAPGRTWVEFIPASGSFVVRGLP